MVMHVGYRLEWSDSWGNHELFCWNKKVALKHLKGIIIGFLTNECTEPLDKEVLTETMKDFQFYVKNIGDEVADCNVIFRKDRYQF